MGTAGLSCERMPPRLRVRTARVRACRVRACARTAWRALALWLVMTGAVLGQEESPTKPEAPPAAEPVVPAKVPPAKSDAPAGATLDTDATPRQSPPVSADVMYLPDERGKLLPVPAGASLREYLEFLRNKGLAARASLPKFAVEKLSLIGESRDESVRLSALLVVRVFEADAWVRVPVGLVEGVLVDARHEGAGEGLCESRDENAGHHWLLRAWGNTDWRWTWPCRSARPIPDAGW